VMICAAFCVNVVMFDLSITAAEQSLRDHLRLNFGGAFMRYANCDGWIFP